MSPTPKSTQSARGTHVYVNGYALREMRILAGITTIQLVREVANADGKGFDRSFLSRIENGQRNRINPALFNRIVAALKIDRRALLASPHPADAISAPAA